jgi:hypothetical protein
LKLLLKIGQELDKKSLNNLIFSPRILKFKNMNEKELKKLLENLLKY